ncbi:MAG: Na+/H+ antiporter NhaC family protein [Bacteroidaceae bacterium]|nr:Na+/H+ antiporter NhaC family protein [Bacteroidaceae bacterium]
MSRKGVLKGLLALSPIAVLLVVYLAGSLMVGDFYRIPIVVAFLIASLYAVAVSKGVSLSQKIDTFSRGAADNRIMLMVWIFVLAGVFASVAKSVGAVESTVNFTLNIIPAEYLPAGIFIAACFISMSIGTSVGTIVALTPVVTELAAQTGCSVAWLVGIVVGGSFFGDNLSFISDTTIAATQTQGCSMKSKFKANFRLVLPAAIITLIIYLFNGVEFATDVPKITFDDFVKIIPYAVIIVVALLGVNVLLVLTLGVVVAAIIGLIYGNLSILGFFESAGSGISDMSNLIMVTILAGGLLEIVRVNGGIDFVIGLISSRIRSAKVAECSIVLLTLFANICTANNTIAILTVGGISHDIAAKFGVSPRRSASLLDTTSCVIQGVLPYGAQLLMASGLALVSPLEIIPHLYYPMFVGAIVLLSIFFKPFRQK